MFSFNKNREERELICEKQKSSKKSDGSSKSYNKCKLVHELKKNLAVYLE